METKQVNKMFKYTPKQQILKDMAHCAKKHSMNWFGYEDAKRLLQKLHVDTGYTMCQNFQQHFSKTVFYSPKKVSNVPVGSSMFPVTMFEVTEV